MMSGVKRTLSRIFWKSGVPENRVSPNDRIEEEEQRTRTAAYEFLGVDVDATGGQQAAHSWSTIDNRWASSFSLPTSRSVSSSF